MKEPNEERVEGQNEANVDKEELKKFSMIHLILLLLH